jgi:hypothetical protein
MKLTVALMLALAVGGCDWNQDQAGTVAGPGLTVHCDNLTPGSVGDSTVKVNCPAPAP